MLSFFPQDVLDEIWDLIESFSVGFPIFSWFVLPPVNSHGQEHTPARSKNLKLILSWRTALARKQAGSHEMSF